MIVVILDDLPLVIDGCEKFSRLAIAAQGDEGEGQPVVGRREHVRVTSDRGRPQECPQGAVEVSLEIAGEAEVIGDVAVQGAGGNVEGVGQTIGLDRVLQPANETGGVFEINSGSVQFAQGEPAVTSVPPQTRIPGVVLHRIGVDLDRLAVATEVGEPATEPDRCVGTPGRLSGGGECTLVLLGSPGESVCGEIQGQ